MSAKSKNSAGEDSAAVSVSDQVFAYMKEQITGGHWQPGDKIPAELKLCSLLNVSRVSVRAAITRLSCMGFLESFRGRGTFVCKAPKPIDSMYSAIVLNRSNRLDIFEYRKIIESASAELAAQRASTEMVNRMNAAIQQQQQATTVADIVRYDWEFHYQIAAATGNKLIVRNFEILREAYMQQFVESIELMGNKGLFGHKNITAAIEVRAPVLAKQAMLEHLNYTMHQIAVLRIDNAVEKHLTEGSTPDPKHAG